MKNKIYNIFLPGIFTAVALTTSCSSPDTSEPSIDNTALAIPAIETTASNPVIDAPVIAPVIEETKPTPPPFSHKISKGESLSTIFSKLNLSKTDLHSIIHANELGKQFASIRPGKNLLVSRDLDGQLQQLSYKKSKIDTLIATRVDDIFNVELISKPIDIKIASAQATINSSLFLDGKEAGLSDKTIMQLANIFAWDIDFALNLRKGDHFTVVYEKLLVDNQEFDSGEIILPNLLIRTILSLLSDLKIKMGIPATLLLKEKVCVKLFYEHPLNLPA